MEVAEVAERICRACHEATKELFESLVTQRGAEALPPTALLMFFEDKQATIFFRDPDDVFRAIIAWHPYALALSSMNYKSKDHGITNEAAAFQAWAAGDPNVERGLTSYGLICAPAHAFMIAQTFVIGVGHKVAWGPEESSVGGDVVPLLTTIARCCDVNLSYAKRQALQAHVAAEHASRCDIETLDHDQLEVFA